MGVSPGWGGGARLVGIVGRRAALRLLAWSLPVTSTDGLAIGLLDAVAADEGGARAEAEEFLSGVVKHEAYGKLLRTKKNSVNLKNDFWCDVGGAQQYSSSLARSLRRWEGDNSPATVSNVEELPAVVLALC